MKSNFHFTLKEEHSLKINVQILKYQGQMVKFPIFNEFKVFFIKFEFKKIQK